MTRWPCRLSRRSPAHTCRGRTSPCVRAVSWRSSTTSPSIAVRASSSAVGAFPRSTWRACCASGEGTCIPVEETAEWAASLRRQVDHEKLTEYVSVIHAPITEVGIAGDRYHRYSDEVVKGLIVHRGIDLLIVDGPVRGARLPHIRYPALPYFYDSLTPSATVIVDDIDRRAEQQIVRRWEREFGLQLRATLPQWDSGCAGRSRPRQDWPHGFVSRRANVVVYGCLAGPRWNE